MMIYWDELIIENTFLYQFIFSKGKYKLNLSDYHQSPLPQNSPTTQLSEKKKIQIHKSNFPCLQVKSGLFERKGESYTCMIKCFNIF